ncbi:hypothetical protein PCASD_07021 [Puccinia coronata f. sp. avenae]|uniref:Uncharacterized protein n=1 Tax=Puccinia coronata f. sp. avenae TaxID=200324 RepID=A0A2N5UZR6_9BASI|nr:hypothetical protein PCASD_07021 [Puccinia coronata f. sp. avenae]
MILGVDKKTRQNRAYTRLNRGGDVVAAGELVQACTSYSPPSRYNPVLACRGINPRRAGTSLYQLDEEYFIPRRAGTSLHLLGEENVAPRRAGTGATSPPSKTGWRRGFTGFFT